MVELSGNSGGVTVHDVHVSFIAANNRTLKSVHVGHFNGTGRLKNITVHLEQKPQYVHVTAGSIESPDEARYSFSGLKLTDDGDYRPYYWKTTAE